MAEDPTKKVALVDCDFRRPAVGRYLGLSENGGLTEVVRGKKHLQDVMAPVRKEKSNLKVIPTGRFKGDIYPLLYNDRLAPILKDLKNAFDFLVVDCPPVLPIMDQDFLADMLDAVVMVIRAGKTPRDVVRSALEAMDDKKNILGIVFNGMERQPSNYYYYNYQYRNYYRADPKK
jgi:capsular exopolysaccharide synthesis family protein